MSVKKQALQFEYRSPHEMMSRSRQFAELLSQRRTVRSFSSQSVPQEVILNAVRSANAAPSGANRQPWTYVIVSSSSVKTRLRRAAEDIERELYLKRAPKEFLNDLAPLGTGWMKPHLEEAPYLVVVFSKPYEVCGQTIQKNYYSKESTGLSIGFLLAALHYSGLATLTHTPNPMAFLNEILDRPSYEKPFLIVATGYPKENCEVPLLLKKGLGEVCHQIE